MEKLESLNSSLFEKFKENRLTQLHSVLGGGTVPSCSNNCAGIKPFEGRSPDGYIEIMGIDSFTWKF